MVGRLDQPGDAPRWASGHDQECLIDKPIDQNLERRNLQ
jgi:hypothetical protein